METLYTCHHNRYDLNAHCWILQASFRQWQVERSVPKLEAEVAAATAARDAVVVEQEEEVRRQHMRHHEVVGLSVLAWLHVLQLKHSSLDRSCLSLLHMSALTCTPVLGG